MLRKRVKCGLGEGKVKYLVIRNAKLLSAADQLPDFLDKGSNGLRACKHLWIQFDVQLILIDMCKGDV